MALENLQSISSGGAYAGQTVPAIPVSVTNEQGVMNTQPAGASEHMDWLLDDTGSDPTVDRNMDVNGSVTPVRFVTAPTDPVTFSCSILRLTIAAGTALDIANWPGLSSPLTNGCRFQREIGPTPDVIPLDGELPLKTLEDLLGIFQLATPIESIGPDSILAFTLASLQERGAPFHLDVEPATAGKLVWIVNDDLSTLDGMRISCSGWDIPKKAS